MKDRSPGQTAVSISLPKDLLARIDARAASLDLPRSRYLTALAKLDVARGGTLKLAPEPAASPAAAKLDPAQEIAEFLQLAVPALADYQWRKDDPEAASAAPATGEALEENRFWAAFLEERDEILRLKWIESKKAGYDIGFKQAIQLWLKHRPGWKAAQPPAG